MSERRIMLPNGRVVTESEAQRAVAAIARAFRAMVMETERIQSAFASWHREMFEPIAKAYMVRRLIRILRSEVERRKT